MTVTSVYILGAGGHTKVLLDSLRSRRDISILGILDLNPDLIGKHMLGIPVVDSEENVFQNYSPSVIQLINGIGSTSNTMKRKMIFEKFKNAGYKFLDTIHANAYIGQDVSMGEGIQLMAGGIIQTGSYIGNNVIVNTNTSVDHDCNIGDHVHLAPGVTCCGNVTIGAETHIGCGAVILQGVKIGNNCLIAAGSVVVKDVGVGRKVAGVPAKAME